MIPGASTGWELTDWEQLCQAGPVGLDEQQAPRSQQYTLPAKKATSILGCITRVTLPLYSAQLTPLLKCWAHPALGDPVGQGHLPEVHAKLSQAVILGAFSQFTLTPCISLMIPTGVQRQHLSPVWGTVPHCHGADRSHSSSAEQLTCALSHF